MGHHEERSWGQWRRSLAFEVPEAAVAVTRSSLARAADSMILMNPS